jgi:hypothetical protein
MPFATPDDEHGDLPIWVMKNEPQKKDYHKPQIGAFITAHVRMVVRRAALIDPDAWLYADTDCVVFSRPPIGLDTHQSRYGAWKVECEGEEYRIITKKVYAKIENEKSCASCNSYSNKKCTKKLSPIEGVSWCTSFGGKDQPAKGMNVKKLSAQQFIKWSNGEPPTQTQMHRNNLIKVLGGADMYIERVRRGTKIK